MAGPNDSHYIWCAITAIALQAGAAAQGRTSVLPSSKLLQLAEGLIVKQAQKAGITTYEQLMLYLHVLEVILFRVQENHS